MIGAFVTNATRPIRYRQPWLNGRVLRTTGGLAGLASVALLAGCVAPSSAPGEATPAARVTPTAVAPPRTGAPASAVWVTQRAQVRGVDRDGSGAIDIKVSVPAGDGECARNVRLADYGEESNVVYTSVVVDANPDRRACPSTVVRAVPLESAALSGSDTIVVINGQAWRESDRTYSVCQLVACQQVAVRHSPPGIGRVHSGP